MTIYFLAVLLSNFAWASDVEATATNISCKGMQLSNGLKEVVLETSRNDDSFFSASGKLEDAYFSIQGQKQRGIYSLTIRLAEPMPNGTGIYSDGTFDQDGFLRLSFITAGTVHKMFVPTKGSSIRTYWVNGLPFRRFSKCKCGPVERPVLPTLPIC